MRILVDIRPALKRPTGVGVYIASLFSTLVRKYPDDEWYAFSSSFSDRLDRSRLPEGVRSIDLRIPVRLLNRMWIEWSFGSIEFMTGKTYDIVHSPTPFPIPSRRGRKTVVVHDVWFLQHPEECLDESGQLYPKYFARAMREADHIFCVSHTTAERLESYFPWVHGKRTVTHLGLPEEFKALPLEETLHQVRNRYALPEHYILFIGALIPRKNPVLLIRAHDVLGRMGIDIPLVIVGDGPLREELEKNVSRPERVYFLSHVRREDLPALYALASFLIMTSRDEGFGIPILEALAMKTPVLAVRAGSIPEIGKDYITYTPSDPEAIAHAMKNVLEHGIDQQKVEEARQYARTYSWEKTAERTYEVFCQLCS